MERKDTREVELIQLASVQVIYHTIIIDKNEYIKNCILVMLRGMGEHRKQEGLTFYTQIWLPMQPPINSHSSWVILYHTLA